MSTFGDAALRGLAWGMYDTTNIMFGGLTSLGMYRSGLDPFNTLYVDLESPSGFSSWAHPSYATPLNVNLNANGIDTTFAPLTSAIANPFWSYGLLGGGGIFGFGFPTTSTFVSANTYTPYGVKHHFHGYC